MGVDATAVAPEAGAGFAADCTLSCIDSGDDPASATGFVTTLPAAAGSILCAAGSAATATAAIEAAPPTTLADVSPIDGARRGEIGPAGAATGCTPPAFDSAPRGFDFPFPSSDAVLSVSAARSPVPTDEADAGTIPSCRFASASGCTISTEGRDPAAVAGRASATADDSASDEPSRDAPNAATD
ncbi:hypothetical protein [Burkholderia pseudomultivorans]|uniref:hypothetical protein n=1 Tax=Burkholderia pseudomultivorans TaxID=1207504 RepID=UPI0039BF253C